MVFPLVWSDNLCEADKWFQPTQIHQNIFYSLIAKGCTVAVINSAGASYFQVRLPDLFHNVKFYSQHWIIKE